MEAVLTNASGRMTLGSSVVRIGSAQDNHVVINDPKVAPHHAEIRPQQGHGEYSYTITDIGSSTGTYVNERRLVYNVPSLLHPNDTIYIGDASFNYEVIGAPLWEEVDQSTMATSAGAINRSPVPEARPLREMSPERGAAAPSPFAINPLPPQGPLRIVPPESVPHSPAASASPAQSAGSYSPFVSPSAGVPGGPFVSASTGASVNVGPASLLAKENRRKLWLAAGLTVLAILLVAFLFGSSHSPGKTLDTFCSALQSGDYQTAYNQFSPGKQGESTEARFASSFAGKKRITSCTYSSLNVSGNTAQATIITNSNHVSTVWLIQDRSFNWEIDGLSGL